MKLLGLVYLSCASLFGLSTYIHFTRVSSIFGDTIQGVVQNPPTVFTDHITAPYNYALPSVGVSDSPNIILMILTGLVIVGLPVYLVVKEVRCLK